MVNFKCNRSCSYYSHIAYPEELLYLVDSLVGGKMKDEDVEDEEVAVEEVLHFELM